MSLNIGVNLNARKKWVLLMMTDKSREITAIQTIRNAIMTTTFFATSASLMAFWAFNTGMNEHSLYTKTQYLLLGGSLVISFLNMMFSTRGFFHVSFLICSKSLDPEIEAALKESTVRRKVKRRLFPKMSGPDVAEGGAAQDVDLFSENRVISEKLDKWTAKHVPSVVRLLRRSTIHFTAGVRFYYLAIPVAMWIISPWGLLIGSVSNVLLMYYSDRWV